MNLEVSTTKKIFITYFTSSIALALLVTVVKGLFSLEYVSFWLGILLGTMLPDIDHLLYVYYLRPHELTSQRTKRFIEQKNFKAVLDLLYNTRNERTSLVFHTAIFQIVFSFFSFYVISSTSNMFGRGLVLAFLLHLVLDQYLDFLEKKNIQNWFHNFEVNFNEKQAKYYIYSMFGVLLFLSFVV